MRYDPRTGFVRVDRFDFTRGRRGVCFDDGGGDPPTQDPPKPAAPPEGGTPEQFAELKKTMGVLADEKTELAATVARTASVLGRIRTELDLPKDATDDQWSEALKGVRSLKKAPAPNATPPGETPAGFFSQADLDGKLTAQKKAVETDYQTQLTDERKKTTEADGRWRSDRVRNAVTSRCRDNNLDATLVMSRLRDATNGYPWEVIADPDGDGVLIATRGTIEKFYHKGDAKFLQLDDALATIQRDNPGVSLKLPTTGTAAGLGAKGGPLPSRAKDPSAMTPQEKVAGAFAAS